MTDSATPSVQGLPKRWVALAIVVLLSAVAALTVVPGYLGGSWPWQTTPQVAQLDALRQLQTTGLALPGWQLTSADPITINKQDWVLGEYAAEAPDETRFALLLRPQPWHSNQPQLEWIDLSGAQNWRTEARPRLRVDTSGGPVQARFFTARGEGQSFAVVQWYAMPQGGHPAPGRWFWANQRSQLTQHALTPWVAVCLLLPLPPLANGEDARPLATDLTAQIQQQLTATVFERS